MHEVSLLTINFVEQMKIPTMVKEMRQRSSVKHTPAQLKQNFGLTEAAFEEILERMKAGDEALFEKVFLAQFEACMSFLMYRYKVSRSVAYDVSMDALLKFRKRLLAGKISYGNMRYLFTRMASQFLSDTTKHPTLMLEDMEDDRIDETEVEDETLDALDMAWSQLGNECKNLLDHFYYKKVALKSIAIQRGKSEAALRKQKQRCLEKLRLHFSKFYQG